MPSYKVELLAPAWKELDEISNYHLQNVGGKSARDITSKILNAIDRLSLFPNFFPKVPDEELSLQHYRMLVCGKYLCIYRLIAETVFVYHIVNGAREYSKLLKGELNEIILDQQEELAWDSPSGEEIW